MLSLIIFLLVVAELGTGAFGQACASAKPPALTAEQSAAVNRARNLGYKPTSSTLASAANVQRVKRLLPKKDFEYLFPMANEGKGPTAAPYNYDNFLTAVAMFPDFCNSAAPASSYGNLDKTCLNELATLFAMFAQEVGFHNPSSSIPEWRQGLYYFNEIGCPNSGTKCKYCQDSNVYNYRCVSGQYYFGRGAMQLSWNYNYGFFSSVIFGDSTVLLKNPDKVTSKTDTASNWLALAAALWFYMTPQNPKPSMHDVATGYWQPNSADVAAKRLQGFGVQTMILNGALECGGSKESSQSQYRINYYKGFTNYFGINPGSNLGCAQMKAFDSKSSAATPQHWERSWTADCKCTLVSYTTAWSIFDGPISRSYQKCLDFYFSKGAVASPSKQPTTKSPSKTTPASTNCNSLSSCAKNCKVCKAALKCTTQSVTDELCQPCATGQSWWPCNVKPSICYCSK